MKNKVALITGSTSGIGLGIAKKLASDGNDIVLNGFGDIDEINKIVQSIQSEYHVRALFVAADLTQPKDVINMIEISAKQMGSIDILVNNAGIQHVSPIEDFPDDKWEKVLRLDLIASFYTTKYSIKHMKAGGWGRIINIASAHGLVASPFKSAYVAAKHGVVGMTKSVALELAKDNITCNAICPGYVKTPLVLNQIKDTAKARGISEEDVINNVMLGPQATKKFVEISEVADLVSYLCSNSASSITGASLTIDGGWTSS
jgi:3-hydroxybutyrate dehydrogenase